MARPRPDTAGGNAGSLLSRAVKAVLLALYRRKGWTLLEVAPVPRRCVILGAPHTSNWDFVFFLGAAREAGIRAGFVGKKSLFRWPIGGFMRDMGGIAVDRSRRANFVDQIVGEFAGGGDLALLMAPEGTRGGVPEWRSGFYHIAHGAGVPIVPGWVDNAAMTGGIGPAIHTTGDFAADLRRIAAFYQSVLPRDPRLGALYRQTGLMAAA